MESAMFAGAKRITKLSILSLIPILSEVTPMSLNKFKISVIAAVASLGATFFGSASTANAGTLDLSAYGWYASFDQNISLTILSTNNNSIFVSLEKFADFTRPANSGVFQPMNIVFRQTSTSAVPSIVIEDETILNDTGSTWGGFRFLLEGGVGGHAPSFAASSTSLSVGPQFSAIALLNSKELRVSGGSLSSGSFPNNLWTPGVDAGAITINANPFTSGSLAQTFVFKEQPILIPLPAAAWTSLSGLVGVGLLVGAKQARKILA